MVQVSRKSLHRHIVVATFTAGQTHQRVRLQLSQVRHAPLAPGSRQAAVEEVELVWRAEHLRSGAGGVAVRKKTALMWEEWREGDGWIGREERQRTGYKHFGSDGTVA